MAGSRPLLVGAAKIDADDEAVRRRAFGREPVGIDNAEPGTGGLYGRRPLDPSPENPT